MKNVRIWEMEEKSMKKKKVIITIVSVTCICVLGYFGWYFLKPKPEITLTFKRNLFMSMEKKSRNKIWLKTVLVK